MRILVTGGNGALAKALRAFLPEATYLGRDQLDVTDSEQVFRAIIDDDPDVVIHAAAITDHQCPDLGSLINTNIIGTLNVARAIGPLGKMVYLSTHYVYPGERGNYRETDECRPIGTYAWTKLAGEEATKTCQSRLIIRGSWYTVEKVRLWQDRGALLDAYCNREPVDVAAQKIAKLVAKGAWGVYNIGGARRTFHDIASDSLRAEYQKPLTAFRSKLDLELPYAFPPDSSVNTAKYESLGL